MEPADAEAHYSEQLVRLPNLGLFLTSNRNATPAGDFGLPGGRVLYGCLQSLFKYIPKYDHLLPAIAAEVPEALFVFLEGKPSYMTAVTRERLERAFAVAGLDASRHVVFLPRVSKTQYLALQRRMDVLVDSIGWSGGNTSISALEAGVPIVSLPGAFMRGRHTSAMLRMIGCEDLIAVSEEDFVARLVALGRHRDLRRETCQRIVERSPRLHEDRSVIDAVDRYLKAQLRH
jgi:predicted O-linked N-acetylglucosamine transferase (SPINDLY family)